MTAATAPTPMRTRARPLIGLSTYVEQARWGAWDLQAALVPDAYPRWLRAAGGLVAMLPPDDPGRAGEVVAAIDALVVPGGPDLAPDLYQARRHPRTGPPASLRDTWEIALIRAALDQGTPLLGVCRGAQLLNVALGGTLEQHLPDRVGHDDHCPLTGAFARHTVRVAPGTLLDAIAPGVLDVPTYHHQAVLGLGEGVRAVAHAEDGTIEAIELPGRDFALGVQWHPEAADDVRLATALVAAGAARTRR